MAESVSSFLLQYYDAMIRSPSDSIGDFYNSASVITRRDRNGALNSASTLEGIRDMITSSPELRGVELSLVHDQPSILDCVFVVVMGLGIDEDDLHKSFVHSLYLVPSSWYTGGREEGGSRHAYSIQNDMLLVLASGSPLQQVTPPSKSQIQIGTGDLKHERRTYASLLGRKSPPGPGSFPPPSRSKGGSNSAAKRHSCAFVDLENDDVKSSVCEGIESPPDSGVAVSEFLKEVEVEMCFQMPEEEEVIDIPKGGCAEPVSYSSSHN